MPDSLTLQFTNSGDSVRELADQVVILTNEAQEVFAERYGDYDWGADMNVPQFWFEREPKAVFHPHFVGSVSGIDDTWLWGWTNINHWSASSVAVAERLQQLGQQLRCDDLITSQQPMNHREHLAFDYVMAAMAVSGLPAPVYYRAPVGGGSSMWFVLENREEFDLPAPSAVHIIGLLGRLVQSGLMADHRLAVRAYGTRRAGLTFTESGDLMTLVAPDGEIQVTFDGHGRIANIHAPALTATTAAANDSGPSPRRTLRDRLWGRNSSR